MYNVSQVTQEREIPSEAFLEAYGCYIEGLKKGEIVIHAPFLSSAWSMDAGAISSKEVRPGLFFQKAVRPVIQLRAHFYAISGKEVKPMSFGKGSVPWGLQFGFPLLYRDSETKEILETLKAKGGNLPLFHALKEWMRGSTRPVKKCIEGVEVMTTLRKGVKCEM